MNVLSFSYCFPRQANPTWGVFVQQRLAALAKHVELQVASPVPTFPLVSRLRGGLPPRQEVWEGLTVHRPRFFYFPGVLKSTDALLYGWGLRRWLGQLCDRWRPDVLDAHFVWPDGVGVWQLARDMGIPYVVTLRGTIYPCLEIPWRRRQVRSALAGAAAVISVSSPMAAEAEAMGVGAERLHVIPNAVDAERFRPRDRQAARKDLDLPADGRIIVSVAHVGPTKGHWETLEALASLPDDVSLVIVGGDRTGGKDGRALRSRIAELGLQRRVVLPGRQPYERIPLYFNAADVSVLASYREGCPNVVLESLASGTPAVVSDVGAAPDLVQDGVNGRLIPARDWRAVLDALRDVLGRTWSADQVRQQSPSVRPWACVANEVSHVLAYAVGEMQ